jgi:hypothetical protein
VAFAAASHPLDDPTTVSSLYTVDSAGQITTIMDSYMDNPPGVFEDILIPGRVGRLRPSSGATINSQDVVAFSAYFITIPEPSTAAITLIIGASIVGVWYARRHIP